MYIFGKWWFEWFTDFVDEGAISPEGYGTADRDRMDKSKKYYNDWKKKTIKLPSTFHFLLQKKNIWNP